MRIPSTFSGFLGKCMLACLNEYMNKLYKSEYGLSLRKENGFREDETKGHKKTSSQDKEFKKTKRSSS